MSTILDKSTEKQAVKPPGMWNVVFHNDDYTSFELVIVVLMGIFNKTEAQAVAIAQHVHQQGKGIAGQYSKDMAETKQTQALEFAQANESPLRITTELA